MRYFLLLAALGLLFGAATAAPLPTDTLRINRLPAAGLLLQKGWRYHPGDNSAWARPDFDDSAWDTLNPTRPQRQLPARLGTGINWLRLRFELGDSLRQRALLLLTSTSGAWELYLDGQLLGRDGILHPDPSRVQVNPNTTEPLELPGAGRAAHVLAVRFAPWQYPLLQKRINETPLFSTRLQSGMQLRKATAERAAVRTTFIVVGGVAGLLMLLHLAFFYYNPARRANLYFAFYTGALSLGALAIYFEPAMHFSSPVEAFAFELVSYLLLWLSSLWAARALYALFGFRTGWLYAGLCVSGGALLVYF